MSVKITSNCAFGLSIHVLTLSLWDKRSWNKSDLDVELSGSLKFKSQRVVVNPIVFILVFNSSICFNYTLLWHIAIWNMSSFELHLSSSFNIKPDDSVRPHNFSTPHMISLSVFYGDICPSLVPLHVMTVVSIWVTLNLAFQGNSISCLIVLPDFVHKTSY